MATGTKKRNHSPTISASVHPAPQWSVDKTTGCHRGRPFIPGIFPIPSMPSIVPDMFGSFVIPDMSALSAIPGISTLFVIPGMSALSAVSVLPAVPFIPGISSAPSASVVVPFSICIPVIAGSGMFMAGSGSETFHGSVPATDRSFRRPVPGFLFSVSCPALPTFRSFPFSPMPPPFAGSLIFAEPFCFPVPSFCTGMCRAARPKAK